MQREDVERLAAHYDEQVHQHDGIAGLMPNLRSERGKETRDIHAETAQALRALLDRAEKAEAERDKLRADGAAEAGPVAWAESYDGGNYFTTVSLTKTRHHTFPLYARPLARPSAPETLAWAVVGEDGTPVPGSVTSDEGSCRRSAAEFGLSVVRVAIYVVEDRPT